MQAIETKFIPPTDNNLNKRIRAKCDAKSEIFDWQDNKGIEENHILAAYKLCVSLNWACKQLHTGSVNDRYYHVLEKLEKKQWGT